MSLFKLEFVYAKNECINKKIQIKPNYKTHNLIFIIKRGWYFSSEGG